MFIYLCLDIWQHCSYFDHLRYLCCLLPLSLTSHSSCDEHEAAWNISYKVLSPFTSLPFMVSEETQIQISGSQKIDTPNLVPEIISKTYRVPENNAAVSTLFTWRRFRGFITGGVWHRPPPSDPLFRLPLPSLTGRLARRPAPFPSLGDDVRQGEGDEGEPLLPLAAGVAFLEKCLERLQIFLQTLNKRGVLARRAVPERGPCWDGTEAFSRK